MVYIFLFLIFSIRIICLYFSIVFEGSETRTPSPESRQEHWQNAFDKNYTKPINIIDCLYILKDDSETVLGGTDVSEVTFAQFSSNNQLIVSSSSNKTLKVMSF